MTGVIGLKRIIRFFKKALTYFNTNKTELKHRIERHEKIVKVGKTILEQIVESFNQLEITAPSLCMLVDNDSKVFIKVMDIRMVVGLYVISENVGSLITYRADTWSDDWKEYTIPNENSIRFDKIRNVRIGQNELTDPENYGFDILEYLIQIGNTK